MDGTFWLATSVPFFATIAIVVLTGRLRPVLRTMLVGIVYFASLPAGFVLVMRAIDPGPGMRRATDAIATLPMMAVWVMTALVVGVTLWVRAISKKL